MGLTEAEFRSIEALLQGETGRGCRDGRLNAEEQSRAMLYVTQDFAKPACV